MAWVANTVAAINAADTKVILVILFLHMVAEAKEALSSLLQRAASLWRYFITRFQRSASFCAGCAMRRSRLMLLHRS
jgi:ribosomal protein S26